MNVRPSFGIATTIAFFLTPNFSMIAFTSAVEVLRLANRVTERETFIWRLYSPDGQAVVSSNGIAVFVDGAYAQAPAMSECIVCAGLDVQKYDHTALIARLRKLAAEGVAIGAVCTGTYVLAKAGLLDDHRCAIHWENYAPFREEFPQIKATQELFEIDRNRFTCAGGTASIDMMLALITSKLGTPIATLVTDGLVHHRMRDRHEQQRMSLCSRLGVSHPRLLAAIAEMEKRLEHPVSCSQLAATVNVSSRQLDRLFQAYLETTPTRYYLEMRLDRARQLLRQTSMSVVAVGLACGFTAASHFTKCYRDHFGRTPTGERTSMREAQSRAALPDVREHAAA